ncbi:hypothetical protein BH11MYX2_BH11MYX2_06840 [soil metagenome]
MPLRSFVTTVLVPALALVGACGSSNGDLQPDAPVGTEGTGYVHLVDLPDGFGNTATAEFLPSAATQNCTQIGGCAACEAVASQAQKSAGVLSASVAGTPVFTMAFTNAGYTPPSYVPPADANGPLWGAGAAIVVEAAGGEIPAFASSMTAPTTVAVSMPKGTDEGAPLTQISVASALSFAWTGGKAGDTFQANLVDNHGHSLLCSADAARGTFAVPSAALASLTLGFGTIQASTLREQALVSGGYGIVVSAAGAATDDSPSHPLYALEVNYE